MASGGRLKLGIWLVGYLALLGFGSLVISRELNRIIATPERLSPTLRTALGGVGSGVGDLAGIAASPVAQPAQVRSAAPEAASVPPRVQDEGAETGSPKDSVASPLPKQHMRGQGRARH